MLEVLIADRDFLLYDIRKRQRKDSRWGMKEKNRERKKIRMTIPGKFLLVYGVCGLLPVILVACILIKGYGDNLNHLAQESEKTELSFVEKNLLEEYNIVLKVSEELFFDKDLEKIAFTKYDDAMEMRNDYRKLTYREDYLRFYQKNVADISFYIENDTLYSNSIYIKVDDAIRNSEWYQHALAAGGKSVWHYMYDTYERESFLVLSRLIRTKEREDVCVVNLSLRNSKLLEAMGERNVLTCLVLDDSVLIAKNGDTNEEEILQLCEQYRGEEGSFQVRYKGEDYMLTIARVQFDSVQNQTTLLSLQAYKDIMKSVYQRTAEITFYVGASLLCAIVMISVFSIRYGKRINNFRIEMAKAAQGNFKLAEKVGGNDEIAELFDNLHVMVESIKQLLNAVYQEQVLKEQLKSRQKEVEFKMLANQINPHFLYNTLETIRMKARATGNAEVEDIVKMLSVLMRRNIEVTDSKVPLKSELQLVEYYLKIQKYRFEDRIQFGIDVLCDIDDCKILPLLIQPLVENAFVHGLEGKKGGGEIKVIIHRSDLLRICVRDNGSGMTEEKLESIRKSLEEKQALDSSHIGINNVNQRIKLMYGEGYGLLINSEWKKGTEVIIELPLECEGEEKNV